MPFPTPEEIGWGGPQGQLQADPSSTLAQFTGPEQIASGGYLPWAQDSYASQAGFAVESPEWNRIYALEQQYRNNYNDLNSPSFFDFLAQTDPELAQSIRNPNTEAYDQRMRLLGQQGRGRYEQTLANREASNQWAQRLALPGLAAMGAYSLAGLGGPAGSVASGSGGAGGAATTYPLASAGPISVTPTGAGTAAGAVGAGVSDAAGNVIPGTESPPMSMGGAAAGGLTNWLPYIGTGVNALIGATAADRASDAETQALQMAIDEQRRQYDINRQDMEPWLTAGQGALNNLQNPATSFQASPGYDWRRSEGQRDIGNSFSARGGAQSGNALRALTDFNQNLATNEYGNWWNQQAGLAGVGQNTAVNLGSMGQGTASNIGNALQGQGVSRASGIANRYGSIGQGVNDSLNWLWRKRLGYT